MIVGCSIMLYWPRQGGRLERPDGKVPNQTIAKPVEGRFILSGILATAFMPEFSIGELIR